MELQVLALEFKICVVALSQVSNEGAKGMTGVIPFKGSGTIAATGDVCLQIIRDEKKIDSDIQDVDLEIYIVKNRHGRRGKIPFVLDTYTGVIRPNNIYLK